MIKSKLSFIKIILALIIILSFVYISGVVFYMISKKKPSISIDYDVNDQISEINNETENNPILKPSSAPIPALSLTSDDVFDFGKNDQMFSVSKSEFVILDKINASELEAKSKDCGKNKSEKYFKKILSSFAVSDNGLEYNFAYKTKTQDAGNWIVTVVPNNIGYTNYDDFKNDFDLCEAGARKYPFMMSEKYLLFISSCGTGFDDGSGLPHGCDVIRDFVQPTIKLK